MEYGVQRILSPRGYFTMGQSCQKRQFQHSGNWPKAYTQTKKNLLNSRTSSQNGTSLWHSLKLPHPFSEALLVVLWPGQGRLWNQGLSCTAGGGSLTLECCQSPLESVRQTNGEPAVCLRLECCVELVMSQKIHWGFNSKLEKVRQSLGTWKLSICPDWLEACRHTAENIPGQEAWTLKPPGELQASPVESESWGKFENSWVYLQMSASAPGVETSWSKVLQPHCLQIQLCIHRDTP